MELNCTFVLLLCHLPACCLRWLFTCPELKGDINVIVSESFNRQLLLHVFVLIYFLFTYVFSLCKLYKHQASGQILLYFHINSPNGDDVLISAVY